MLDWLFPESAEMGLGALVFMLAVYGYILCRASELISHGSEMLLLLYGPGIVGGLVLPILGSIPDCAVIIISGTAAGTKEEVEAQVSIGVGALVGSTIFILTLPWAAAIYLGRRDYDRDSDAAAVTATNRPKLTHFSLTSNCVTLLSETAFGAKIMIAVAASYLVVQIPSYSFKHDADGGVRRERPYELFALALTFVSFVLYCCSSVLSASATDMDRRKQEALRREQWKKSLDQTMGQEERQEMVFKQFDADGSGLLDAAELSAALSHLGLKVDRIGLNELMSTIDVGHEADGDAGAGDGKVSLNEFKAAVSLWVSCGQSSEGVQKSALHSHFHKTQLAETEAGLLSPDHHGHAAAAKESTPLKASIQHSSAVDVAAAADGENDCEEAEEEQMYHLSDFELNMEAGILLLVGTIIVALFTDPMCDCLAHAGTRLDISPFYLSFVVVPVISNASELMAGLMFAKKKTNESISMTLATFNGTATINSTLCLFIFLAIVYLRQLTWSYTAEVAAVLTVIVVVGLNAMRKNIFLWQAVLVACMYPVSILIVYTLENFFGLD